MKRLLLLLLMGSLSAQTIQEKKEALVEEAHGISRNASAELSHVNEELKLAKKELKLLYEKGRQLHAEGVDLKPVVQEIQEIRKEIEWIEEVWKEAAQESEGSYALWHQPMTTVEQFIIDYGSGDYVYLIPPHVGDIPLSIASTLPIPRESWEKLITLVLNGSGIGIQELGSLARRLYLFNEEPQEIVHITDSRDELITMAQNQRVCFVMEGAGLEALIPFVDHETTLMTEVGGSLFICTSASQILKLLQIYDFVAKSVADTDYKILPLKKIGTDEMSAILTAQIERLLILPIEPSALFLSGGREQLERASELVERVEKELDDPKEMTVYTYTCLHGEPKALGEMLTKVYELMHEDVKGSFVVSPQTSSIVMVVEEGRLPKLKRLLKRIDVPRKMVRIDVLFFEKKLNGKSHFGLDLLHFGKSREKTGTNFRFANGILSFLTGRSKHGWAPAYDIAYQFLMSQDDVQINAHPSVTTMNQTEANIKLTEEISIDTGAIVLEGTDQAKNSYSREEYGITLKITPTVHTDWEGGGADLIHLQTDVLFDTIGGLKKNNDRPPVAKRHITNEVRVADGETVILGGLRSKESRDSSAGLPFLGEIPYIGKLFCQTQMNDQETEMYIFITPHIINNPQEELKRFRQEELAKRPGDSDEFLARIEEGKRTICERSLRAILGRDI